MGPICWIAIFFFCGIIGHDVNLLINRLTICMLLSLNDFMMLSNRLLKLCCELMCMRQNGDVFPFDFEIFLFRMSLKFGHVEMSRF